MRRSLGHIEQLGRNHYKVFVSLGTDADGKRRRVTKTIRGTRHEAELLIAKMCGETLGDDTTLSDYVRDHYLPSVERRVRPKTFYTYERVCRDLLEQPWSCKRMGDLASVREQIARWVESTDRVGGQRNRYKMLRQILNAAVRDGIVNHNVMLSLPVPRTEVADKPVIQSADMSDYLRAVEGSFIEAPVVLAMATGMRRSEICGLRWDDIDFSDRGENHHGTFTITRTYHGKGDFEEPKSRTSRRTIYLPTWAGERLERLQHGEWVADGEDGTPMHPDVLSHWWGRKTRHLPHVPFKNIRHSVGTMLVREGKVPIADVQQLLGHSSTSVTERFYLQKSNETSARNAAALGNFKPL